MTTIGYAAAASVTPSVPVANYGYNASNTANETLADAISIGNLVESNATVNAVGSSSSDPNATNSYNVTVGSGTNLQLGLQNINTLYTDVQILDSQGNVIADSAGNAYEQSQYNKIISSNGLSVAAGTYTVQLSNTPGSAANQVADFNTVNTLGTSLSVSSQLTQVDQSEYYKFDLADGNNLKLAFQNTTGTSAAQVQLYNSAGQLVADNQGNSLQQQAFSQLTSGTGLTAAPGSYVVKVSYAPNADTSQNQNYNFQLYSGSSYASKYTTTASAVTTSSAADSVTANAEAQVYGRSAYNSIDETASTAVNIGWLQENKSRLDVTSIITAVDPTDYYQFTLQQGNNLKLAFTNQTNTAGLRVQVYTNSGDLLIADSGGTVAQQAAYTSLTSYNGLTEQPGNYIVKVSYAGTPKTNQPQQEYNFQVYSGTTFVSSYNTTASAQTLENALLSGETVGGASLSSTSELALASYLNTSLTTTTPISVFGSTTA